MTKTGRPSDEEYDRAVQLYLDGMDARTAWETCGMPGRPNGVDAPGRSCEPWGGLGGSPDHTSRPNAAPQRYGHVGLNPAHATHGGSCSDFYLHYFPSGTKSNIDVWRWCG